MVSRLSSNILDKESSQGVTQAWRDDEIQSIREAGKISDCTKTIFDVISSKLSKCGGSHNAMLHIPTSHDVSLLLSSCSDKPLWRQMRCTVPPGNM
jgi:hypothetical protein